MSKGPRKIKWAQFCADRDAEAAIEIDAPGKDAPFRIAPAERWVTAFTAATSDDERGAAILGEDWARWVAAGRTYAELDAIYTYAERMNPGE